MTAWVGVDPGARWTGVVVRQGDTLLWHRVVDRAKTGDGYLPEVEQAIVTATDTATDTGDVMWAHVPVPAGPGPSEGPRTVPPPLLPRDPRDSCGAAGWDEPSRPVQRCRVACPVSVGHLWCSAHGGPHRGRAGPSCPVRLHLVPISRATAQDCPRSENLHPYECACGGWHAGDRTAYASWQAKMAGEGA